MMMLTHRICMALRGMGRLHTVDSATRAKAETLLRAQAASVKGAQGQRPTTSARAASTHVLSWKRTKFLML
jgi:hypothetical protein